MYQSTGVTIKKVAELLGVSTNNIAVARIVRDTAMLKFVYWNGIPEVLTLLLEDALSLRRAHDLAQLPDEEQRRLLCSCCDI